MFFKRIDGQREALGFAIGFTEVEIRRRFLWMQPLGVQESGFGGGKITERDGGDAEKQERVIIVRMKLQLALELLARLRIGFLSAEFEDGVAKKAVGIGGLWVNLNGPAKFGNGGVKEKGGGISGG